MAKKQISRYDPRINPDPISFSPGSITVGNPFDALLPPDKLTRLAQLSPEEKNLFYGRVVSSVFGDPAYQQLVFDKAKQEFDNIAGKDVSSGELTQVVEEVVKRVLASRNQ